MSESTSQASFWMAGFQATLIGCFWVTPEAPALSCQFGVIAERKRSGWLVVCGATELLVGSSHGHTTDRVGGFAYIWTLRSRTIEFANTLKIVGAELTDAAKDYQAKHSNTTRLQLMQVFAGRTGEIWTDDSLTRARFTLAAECALFIALLAFSFNLGIELLAHPVTKTPLPTEHPLAEKTSQLQDVHFDLNMSKLGEDAKEKLSNDATVLSSIFKQFPKATLIIEGHCDDQGGIGRNLTLGYQRAEVVEKALMADGIQASKMSIASHGNGSPLCVDLVESCRQKNRRVNLRVVE